MLASNVRRRASAWILSLSCVAAACSSSTGGPPGNDAAGNDARGNDAADAADAAHAADAADAAMCVQTQNPSICAPIVRCAPCADAGDGTLCGEAPQLGGCDMEGAVCVGACDVPCTCTGGFWRCELPEGQACRHDSCVYLQNYGGGGADVFSCCPGDGGAGAVWRRGGCSAG